MDNEHKLFREFGKCRLDVEKKFLWCKDQPVQLPLKAIELLCVLVESGGSVVTKDEIWHDVWKDSFVEETNLTHNIYLLRKIFKDLGEADLIETVPRRGYRFAGEVRKIGNRNDELIIEKHTQTQTLIEVQKETEEAAPPRFATLLRRRYAALVSALVLVALVGGFAVWRFSQPTVRNSAEIKSIAVLPFKSFDANADDENLRLRITDSLITKLGNLEDISVRPTSSMLPFLKDETDALEIGKKLGVDAILDGRIQQEGERLRVTLQLIAVKNGEQLWSEQFDGQANQLLSLQDAISNNLVNHLRLPMSREQTVAFVKRPTENAEAFQAFSRGRYLWNLRTGANLVKAISEFEEAIKLDPNFTLAYAGLADCYALLGVYDAKPPLEAYPKAKEYAGKALELDPNLAEAHTTLAFVTYRFEWNWHAAEDEFRQAIKLKPNYATAHHWYGEYLMANGRFDEGKSEFARALEIDPTSLIINTDLGYGLFLARRYDESISQLEKTLALNPNFPLAYYCLADAFDYKNQKNESVSAFKTWMSSGAYDSSDVSIIENAYLQKGFDGYLEARLAWATKEDSKGYFTKFDIARFYAETNRNAEALNWLEKAQADHSADLIFVKVHPIFANLRTEPRFQEILRKMNLAE